MPQGNCVLGMHASQYITPSHTIVLPSHTFSGKSWMQVMVVCIACDSTMATTWYFIVELHPWSGWLQILVYLANHVYSVSSTGILLYLYRAALPGNPANCCRSAIQCVLVRSRGASTLHLTRHSWCDGNTIVLLCCTQYSLLSLLLFYY